MEVEARCLTTITEKNYLDNCKTELSLKPQAMYNQFKRPSAGVVRELYYIYKKNYDLRLRILGLMMTH